MNPDISERSVEGPQGIALLKEYRATLISAAVAGKINVRETAA